MRILPRAQREAMFEIYSFCRAVDDIADDPGPREPRRAQLANAGAATSTRSMRGAPPPQLAGLAQAVRDFDLQREDFLAIIDGMEMDVVADIRAPDRATLDLYCDRVACAVGRLSVRVFGMERDAGSCARASSRPRAAAHQHLARPRRGRVDRPALSAARGAARRRHHQHRSGGGAGQSGSARPAAPSSRWRKAEFREAARDHGAKPAPRGAGAADHGRGLSPHSRRA